MGALESAMNNYDKMLEAARVRFLEYDIQALARRAGVTDGGDRLLTRFLGEAVTVRKADGQIFLEGRPAGFGEGLTIYDWLCDRRPDAKASYEFCPVSSLPGILVQGSGLVMNCDALAAKIDKNPAAFLAAVEKMGGKMIPLGDLGCELMAFPDLPVRLKFYRADEEFPPSLTLLWDKNILQFIRYETVYYLAGCLRKAFL